VWTHRQEDVRDVEGLSNAIATTAQIRPADGLPDVGAINQALKHLADTFDPEWGGFGTAPKFPSTMSLDLVLRAHQRSPQETAAEIITTSLDAMSSGGMYDHIGGGFARYSVDEKWLVPHFEKML
jgi:uncharacterized protein YyaL (SSP411 family)